MGFDVKAWAPIATLNGLTSQAQTWFPCSKNLSNTGPKMAVLLDLMGYPAPLPTLFASQVLGILSTMLVFSNMYYVKYVLRCTKEGDDSFRNHNRPLVSYQYSPGLHK